MNVITSVRIIGNNDDIRRFIYDNIQINDPTEEDYKLWNCKNFLSENGYFKENFGVPFTTAAILNVFTRYEEVMGKQNILNDNETTTIVVSFESPYESMIPALKAMSKYFKNLIIIGTKLDEYMDTFYGWIIITFGNLLLNVSMNFNELLDSPKDFIEKYTRVIENELTIISRNTEDVTRIVEELSSNNLLNVSNLRFKENKIYFDTLDKSGVEWYNNFNFPEYVHSCLFFRECRNKYFGYSCKLGSKYLANDFLSFTVKKFKFTQNYDKDEDDFLQREFYIGA
jgi:hypothetical protein